MKSVLLEIVENKKIANETYLMKLKGDISDIKNPGEFVEIKLDGYYLRRPISVSKIENGMLVIIYKVLGHGTYDMSKYEPGLKLDVLVGLGNGFTLDRYQKPLLIGGGIGIAPIFGLAKYYSEANIKPVIIYGAANKNELALIEELKKYGDLYICTDDGSCGYHGNVVTFLKNNNLDFDYYHACGPLPMLKALKNYNSNGELSLEARMGCGFGACMGCSIKTTKGPKRVCKEGPVFMASEVIFDEN